jgi:PhnB protein
LKEANENNKAAAEISIAPWLSVSNCAIACKYYQEAFGAIEVYRLESPDGASVLRLKIGSAELWLSDDSGHEPKIGLLGGGSVRMILTVPDPDKIFDLAIKAGGSVIFPVSEDHGWRLGRLADPFGLHWEVGHMI